MALGTITPVALYVVGDRTVKSYDIVGPTSYTAGGGGLTPAPPGFVAAGGDFDVQVENALTGVSGAYDYTAQKLKLFSGATEATGNLSTSTVRAPATAKYRL